jgi:hypothetical protein
MAMRKKYRRQLAAERYSGQLLDGYSNAAMERGKVQEPRIRAAYAFLTGTEPKIVGFAKRGVAGCSPDSLIGDDGVLEIKSAEPHILVELIESGRFPSEHKAQCAGALWVCERQWVDIAIGWFPDVPPARPYPLFVKRLHREPEYMARLDTEIPKFDQEVGMLVDIVRNYVPD